MTCNSVHRNLKALLDGELGFFLAARVHWHLRHCAECRTEWDSLRELDTLLRQSDIVPPESRQPALPRRRPGTAWKWAGGGAFATAALAAFLFLLPTLHQSPRNLSAAAVGAALSHANTWHFFGWKQIHGQRVPWDIWGRRAPFLLYERIGQDITLDNGKQRLHIFPPDSALNRPQGLVISLASAGATVNEGLSSGGSLDGLVNQWDWEQGSFGMSLAQETHTEAIFREQYSQGVVQSVNCNQLFTINRETSLPVGYRLEYQTRVSPFDTEQLSAVYDVSLPRSVTAPPVPTGYQQLDLRNSAASTLAVQSRLLALDPQGNVLIRYQCRMGGLLLTPNSRFSVYIAPPSVTGLRNNKSFAYLASTNNGMGYPDQSGFVFDFESPLQPIPAASPLPTQVRVALSVSPQILVAQSDILEPMPPTWNKRLLATDFHPRQTGEPLFTADVTHTLALPKKPTTTSVALGLPKELAWVFNYTSLEASIAFQRSDYYLFSNNYQYRFFGQVAPEVIHQGLIHKDGTINLTHVQDEQKTVRHLDALQKRYAPELRRAKQRQLAQCAFWLGKWVNAKHAAHPQDSAVIDNMLLAMRYRDAGEPLKSKHTLRTLIQVCEKRPKAWVDLIRQARYAQRTQSFPDDQGYKGPAD
jgi:hypothetical protein